MTCKALGLGKVTGTFIAALCVIVVMLLFAPTAVATMTFSITKTTITVTTTPGGIGGTVGGSGYHRWSARVGPVRYRDKALIASGLGNGWAGTGCYDPVVIRPCPAKDWAFVESKWIDFFGSSTQTYTRADTASWQPGDTLCEGIAQMASFNQSWIPSPAEITPAGSCVALPDPRPEPPLSCSITSTSVTLAHGNLASTAVQGSIATSVATLVCNQTTTVRVQALRSVSNATSTVPVRADSSITSHLTVNGVDGVTGAYVPATANQPVSVNLASTLSSTTPTPGALQGDAIVYVTGQQKPIGITGSVETLPTPAPKSVLNMTLVDGTTSNLGISWGWSTSSTDYGSDKVPANYLVGLFIRNESTGAWFAFKVDSPLSAAASWGSRIQRFHDAWPQGGINEEPTRAVGSGPWCVKLAAASTSETGGQFLPAPGSSESCVQVPSGRKP